MNPRKRCKILLINPRISGELRYGKFKEVGSYLPPYGLLSIAGVLERHGHILKIADADSKKGLPLAGLRQVITDFAPDIIGMTAYSIGRNHLLETAEHIKSFCPSLIVAGGPHVMTFPEDLAAHECFDLLAYGEGEYTMLDIADYYLGNKKLTEVNGIIFRENGVTVKTLPRAPIENLDELPFPAFHLLEDPGGYKPMQLLYKRLPVLTIISGRGCPNNCIFCNSIWGKKVRLNSPEYIISLIKEVTNKFGVREIMFYEDSFCIDKNRVNEICDLLIHEGLDISWSCSANVRTLDKPLLQKMKKAGSWLISIGIESGNDEVLGFIRKPSSTEETKKVCAWADEAGLKIRGFFMLGHPIDTAGTIRQTIDFFKSLPLFTINFTILQLLPGSKFRKIAHNYGDVNYDYSLGTGHPCGELSFVPKGLTSGYLKKMQRRGYREFFIRPVQIWRLIRSIDSWEDARKFYTLAMSFMRLYI